MSRTTAVARVGREASTYSRLEDLPMHIRVGNATLERFEHPDPTGILHYREIDDPTGATLEFYKSGNIRFRPFKEALSGIKWVTLELPYTRAQLIKALEEASEDDVVIGCVSPVLSIIEARIASEVYIDFDRLYAKLPDAVAIGSGLHKGIATGVNRHTGSTTRAVRYEGYGGRELGNMPIRAYLETHSNEAIRVWFASGRSPMIGPKSSTARLPANTPVKAIVEKLTQLYNELVEKANNG